MKRFGYIAAATALVAFVAGARAPANAAASRCDGHAAVSRAVAPGSLSIPIGIAVPHGFHIERIATVGRARELVALPNGDLLVGTDGNTVAIVPNADSTLPGAPLTFTTLPDAPANGIAFSQSTCTIYVATQHAMFSIPYRDWDIAASSQHRIAAVRTGEVAPHSDGDIHSTSSVAVTSTTLYESVGSSCNACVETDPTRATIQAMHLNGSNMTTRVRRIRNAIALAIDPESGHLWAGGAGQDDLPIGHPYEFIDDIGARRGVVDYHWPECEENRHAYTAGADCSRAAVPLIVFPAYSTMIGATFYPLHPSGPYAFSARWRGAIFITQHGSWHIPGGCNIVPQVDVVPMSGDRPTHAVDWKNPKAQWQPFVTGFQPGCGAASRIGRPTGIAVGNDGSLFIADDQTGAIYRVRP